MFLQPEFLQRQGKLLCSFYTSLDKNTDIKGWIRRVSITKEKSFLKRHTYKRTYIKRNTNYYKFSLLSKVSLVSPR